MAKKEQKFKINLSFNDFNNRVVSNAESKVLCENDKEIIISKDKKMILNKKSKANEWNNQADCKNATAHLLKNNIKVDLIYLDPPFNYRSE